VRQGSDINKNNRRNIKNSEVDAQQLVWTETRTQRMLRTQVVVHRETEESEERAIEASDEHALIAAFRRATEYFLSKGVPEVAPAPPAPPAPPVAKPLSAQLPHFGPAALLWSVTSGAIAPLRGSYVIDLHARGGRLERRQDLPAEAFFSIKELRRLVDALGDEYGLLFVALSYRWLSKHHPDPYGFHLGIVASVARLYMHKDRDRSPLTAAFAAKGLGSPDFALFWDFPSLFQEPREPHEEGLFLTGLNDSNIWYGHQLSVCWLQPEVPVNFSFGPGMAQTYEESGFCFVEAAISAGVKVGNRVLDLSKRTQRAMEFAYGGNCVPEARLDSVCAVARAPPLLPDDVRRLLEQEKKFTSSVDLDRVDQLYRAFFDGVTLAATELTFSGLGWTVVQVRQLAGTVLPQFTNLERLDLSNNDFGPDGAKAIAAFCAGSALLVSLSTAHNTISGDGAQQLAAAVLAKPAFENFSGIPLKELRANGLTTLDLSSKGLGLPEAIVLADLVRCASGSLISLDVRGNGINGDGADQLAAAVLESKSMEEFSLIPVTGLRANEVTELKLSFKGLGPAEAHVIGSLLTSKSSLTSISLKGNELGSEGWCTVFDALRDNPQNKIKKWDLNGQGINPTVAKSLAGYVAVSGSLVSLSLGSNPLGDEGAIAVVRALKESKVSKLASLDLSGSPTGGGKKIGPQGAKELAEYISANGVVANGSSLTHLDVNYNALGDKGATAIGSALKESKVSQLKELSIGCNGIGPNGAKAIAAFCAVTTSATRLDVSWNNLDRGGNGVRLIREAVGGRSGFELVDGHNQ
jgi:Ran GTPase-activating protein (RanGAP) involved in mRNA processing and transport